MARLSLLLFVLAALPSCSLGGHEEARGVTGEWGGEAYTSSTNRYPLTLDLTDAGSTITGTGAVELPDGPFEFRIIDGFYDGSGVNLTLRFESPPFQGSINGTLVNTDPGRIEGTLSGRDEVGSSAFYVELVDR